MAKFLDRMADILIDDADQACRWYAVFLTALGVIILAAQLVRIF